MFHFSHFLIELLVARIDGFGLYNGADGLLLIIVLMGVVLSSVNVIEVVDFLANLEYSAT